MAFNPGGITNADPFGAFLTGNVIGREQNRADDQLAMQRAQEQRQQDQFDWSKALRPGQERMQALTIEEAAANNARRALENREFSDMAIYRQRAAQRGDRTGEIQLGAAEIATLPVARAQAAQAGITEQFALPIAQAKLDGEQSEIARRNAATSQLYEAIVSSQAGRALTPLRFSPDGTMVEVANYQGGVDVIPTEQWNIAMNAAAQGIMGGGQAQGGQAQGGQPAPSQDILGFGELYSAPPVVVPQAAAPVAQPVVPASPRPTMQSAATMTGQFGPPVSEVPQVDFLTTGMTPRAARPAYVPKTMTPAEEQAYFRNPYP